MIPGPALLTLNYDFLQGQHYYLALLFKETSPRNTSGLQKLCEKMEMKHVFGARMIIHTLLEIFKETLDKEFIIS